MVVSLYNWDFLVPVGLAVLIGGLIGIERELRKKPAGIGTYVIICVASTLITLVSAFASPNDVTRIAANIIVGVGFLGAGLILHKSHGGVVGLTTAAIVWAVAGIGMALGFGFYRLAIVTGIIVLFAPRIPLIKKR